MNDTRCALPLLLLMAASCSGTHAAQNMVDDAPGPAENIVAAAAVETGASLTDLKFVHSQLRLRDPVDRFAHFKLPSELAGADYGFFDDPAILDQLSRDELSTMISSDYSFRFVADVDGNRRTETYRTGWFRAADGGTGQFLAVDEEGVSKDIWLTEGARPLVISWHHGSPVIWDCNCDHYAPIIYRGGKLHMHWNH